jgi:hypothetical protein
MVGLNGKAQQKPENGLFIINGEFSNIKNKSVDGAEFLLLFSKKFKY